MMNRKQRKVNMTGFMPRKPRFVSGVKRHVSEKKIKLREAPPCGRGASQLLLQMPIVLDISSMRTR